MACTLMPLLTAVLATQAPTDVAGAGHGRNLAEYYKFECRRAKRLITLNIGVFVDDLFCDTYEKTHSSCDEGARALLNKVSDIYQGQLNMRFAAAWVSGAPTDCRSTGGMHDWVRMQLPGLAQQAAFIKLSGCRWDLRGNILPAGRASIGALPSGRAGHRPNNTGAALCHGHTDDVYNVAHELGHIVGFNHYHGWNNAQYGIMDYHNSGLLQDGGVDAKYNGAVQFSPNSPHRDVQVVCNALQSLENNNPSYIVLGAVSTQDPTPPKIIGNEPLVSYDYETKSSMGTRCKIHNNHGSTDYPVNEVAARCKAHCDKNADCVAYSYRDDWGYCHSYTAFKGTETDAAAYTGCFVKLAEKTPRPVPAVQVTPRPFPAVPLAPYPVPSVPLAPSPVPSVPLAPSPVPSVPLAPRPVPSVPAVVAPAPAVTPKQVTATLDGFRKIGESACKASVTYSEENIADLSACRTACASGCHAFSFNQSDNSCRFSLNAVTAGMELSGHTGCYAKI